MKPVLFVCVHNAGRSQMAEAFFNALAAERDLAVRAASAGTAPGERINPTAVEVMGEIGIPLDGVEIGLPAKVRLSSNRRSVLMDFFGSAFASAVVD